ncbi:MAG: hypothetical protein AAGB34_05060 [Planctomycetota bacterium]
MARTTNTSRSPKLCAIDRVGVSWLVVIAEDHAGGGFSIIAAERATSRSALRAILESHGVKRIIRVLGSNEAVVRRVELPGENEAELNSAAQLLGEAELPGAAEEWRRGAGTVPLGATTGSRAVLLTAWVGEASADYELITEEASEHFVSRAAALTFVLDGRSGAIVDARPAGSGGSGDSATIVASSADRSVARASRLAPGNEQALSHAVRAATDQANVEPIEVSAGGLSCDSSTEASLTEKLSRAGSTKDPKDFAAAIGAIELVDSAHPSSTLGKLRSTGESKATDPLERLAVFVSSPRLAWPLIAASLLLAIALPTIGLSLRHASLSSQLARLEAAGFGDEGSEDTERRLALYEELESQRWPMTKLLANLAGGTPVGVELEQIDLRTGDRFSVRGSGESLSLITEMTRKLNDSGVFADVEMRRSEIVDERVTFEIAGRVERPYAEARDLEDFAESTLAERLYGDRAHLAGPGPAGSKPGSTDLSVTESGGDSDRPRGRNRAAELVENIDVTVPEPLEDGALSEMDRREAMAAMGERRKAIAAGDIDTETRQRLEREVEMLRDHLRSQRGGG